MIRYGIPPMLALAVACSMVPRTGPALEPCPVAGKAVGITGCMLVNPALPEGITASGIEEQCVQYAAGALSGIRGTRTVDRTKLGMLMKEHSLTLAGVVKEGDEPDVSGTDCLLAFNVTGFAVTRGQVGGDTDMTDVSYLYKAVVRYRLNAEIIDSRSGEVLWMKSVKAENAGYGEDAGAVDIRELVFRSLEEHIGKVFGDLCG